MALINSLHNPVIKHLAKLADSARYRRDMGEVLLDGIHLLDACLNAGEQPLRVFVAESASANNEIMTLLQRVKAPVSWVSDGVLAKASELKTPSGVLAVYAPPEARRSVQRSVWLDNVQDPGNVGSILRSAAAAGFDAVYLSTACADVWSPRVLRAAMGAHFLMDMYVQADLVALAATFSGSLVTTSLNADQTLHELVYALPVAWVFGNEGEGVSAGMQQRASHSVAIPMPGAMESLNVAAAAAICLFEDVRRRSLPRVVPDRSS